MCQRLEGNEDGAEGPLWDSTTVRKALGVCMAPVLPAGLGGVSLRKIKEGFTDTCSLGSLEDVG